MEELDSCGPITTVETVPRICYLIDAPRLRGGDFISALCTGLLRERFGLRAASSRDGARLRFPTLNSHSLTYRLKHVSLRPQMRQRHLQTRHCLRPIVTAIVQHHDRVVLRPHDDPLRDHIGARQ